MLVTTIKLSRPGGGVCSSSGGGVGSSSGHCRCEDATTNEGMELCNKGKIRRNK